MKFKKIIIGFFIIFNIFTTPIFASEGQITIKTNLYLEAYNILKYLSAYNKLNDKNLINEISFNTYYIDLEYYKKINSDFLNLLSDSKIIQILDNFYSLDLTIIAEADIKNYILNDFKNPIIPQAKTIQKLREILLSFIKESNFEAFYFKSSIKIIEYYSPLLENQFDALKQFYLFDLLENLTVYISPFCIDSYLSFFNSATVNSIDMGSNTSTYRYKETSFIFLPVGNNNKTKDIANPFMFHEFSHYFTNIFIDQILDKTEMFYRKIGYKEIDQNINFCNIFKNYNDYRFWTDEIKLRDQNDKPMTKTVFYESIGEYFAILLKDIFPKYKAKYPIVYYKSYSESFFLFTKMLLNEFKNKNLTESFTKDDLYHCLQDQIFFINKKLKNLNSAFSKIESGINIKDSLPKKINILLAFTDKKKQNECIEKLKDLSKNNNIIVDLVGKQYYWQYSENNINESMDYSGFIKYKSFMFIISDSKNTLSDYRVFLSLHDKNYNPTNRYGILIYDTDMINTIVQLINQ